MNAPIPGTTLFDGAQARKGYALTGQFMLGGGGYLHRPCSAFRSAA